MRIAFLTSIVPDGRPTSGYEIANEAVVTALATLGHEVVPVGFALPRQGKPLDGSVVLATLDFENANANFATQALFAARAVASGLPVSASKLRALAAREASRAMQAAGPFDAVIANSYQMATAFPALLPTRFAYLAHNVEHLSAAQNAESATGAIRRWLYRRDANLLRHIEAKLCDEAAWTWTLSSTDLQTLAVRPDAGCMLPLTVPETGSANMATSGYDIGMIGTWTWEPNRVGLQWFFDEVVPLLDPSLVVAVAGSTPTGMVAPNSVQLLGRVESSDAFLAAVAQVPLVSRGGTGVQLKTIEAFQNGLACVATGSALRGVHELPRNCVRADDAATFANALNARAGKVRRVDGDPFRKAQGEAMLEALDRGLSRLRL